MKLEIYHKNGIYNGSYKTFYENGNEWLVANYKDGLKTGEWKKYRDNGMLLWKGKYFYDKLQGLVEIYHKNEKKALISNFIDGERNGRYEVFYQNGNLRIRGNFKNDFEEGIWKKFYKDGNIFSKYNMEHGKENGIKKIYYKKNTEFNGIKSFNTPLENAQLYKKVKMKNSLKDGKEEIYYPNGKIWEEKNYKKDKLDGKEYKYSKHGNLIEENYYEEGKLLQTIGYFDNNKKQIFKKIQWLETIDAVEEISENYYENGVSKERYKKNNENLIEMEKYYSNKAIKEILVIEDNKKKIKKYNKEGSLIREKILTNNIIKSEE